MHRLAGVMLLTVAGVVPTLPAAEAVAYLSSIGPAPMRFDLATNAALPATWKPLRTPSAMLTNAVASPAVTAAAAVASPLNATNEAALEVANANEVAKVAVPAAEPPGNPNAETASAPVVVATPADTTPNLSVLQELANYIQPGVAEKSTNVTTVLVPVKIGFVPPLSAMPAKSQAIYKIQ